jgi:hypothetical protein
LRFFWVLIDKRCLAWHKITNILLFFKKIVILGQFRDQKSLDLHEKSLDLSNYEIFPHKILKSRTLKKSSILIVKIDCSFRPFTCSFIFQTHFSGPSVQNPKLSPSIFFNNWKGPGNEKFFPLYPRTRFLFGLFKLKHRFKGYKELLDSVSPL